MAITSLTRYATEAAASFPSTVTICGSAMDPPLDCRGTHLSAEGAARTGAGWGSAVSAAFVAPEGESTRRATRAGGDAHVVRGPDLGAPGAPELTHRPAGAVPALDVRLSRLPP